ncbi:CocE/NonD family hydrolase [Aspergillus saccharolyticus JOP 1030-1]|uniref:Alpha/beta-hydrolase n=1 Tax=Aspergillus saccharolyticus JOP 1030-1 TaxID=1450539 RepID=A0A318ZTQ0_9EURO|nr:alpha/beta-hydrolase [Aspergillus saccharolyticus JOP 1030-1]PYH47360.1 alpha/beta-hydrolase [Aspergillus saccharolyticus JOP 1030-1]
MPSPVPVATRPIDKPTVGRNNYQPFGFREETLPQGWSQNGSRPLPCAIHASHDVGIKVRDGSTLYCDVYRPADADKPVPAILAWSPFGKKFNGITFLKFLPWGLGIPQGVLSGLEKFEGPDPAEFVPRGFAIVNVDARGSGDSEGTVGIMGTQEAEDGYDVIEAIAKMPWCNGNVGLAGNSHLAIVQWFIAALRPPSLRAIAPWEACSDLYREQFVRGGVFDAGLFDWIIDHNIQGHGGVEDFHEMYRRNRTADTAYWKDKRPALSRIRIPAYITASYTSFVHTMGSLRGWLQIASSEKWLRLCPWQEWYDMWNCKDSAAELASFFDHYLNGASNGWEQTPRVRTTILRFNQDPLFDIVEEDYPIPRTEYRKMYFHADGNLRNDAPSEVSSLSYNSEKYQDCASFTYTFPARTRLAGIPKAVVYMSCPDFHDLDVYVLVRKLDTQGKPLLNLNIPWSSVAQHGVSPDNVDNLSPREKSNLMFHVGSLGILRASRRAIDRSKSLHENFPFHPHDRDEYVSPGEIVELEIGIWAMGVEYEAGESVRVEVHGNSPLLRGEFKEDNEFQELASHGTHTVHIGGDHASHIILPFV